MAENLMNKVLNEDINVEDVLEWLAESVIESPKAQDISELCSQKNFVTYFLNSIHDIGLRNQALESPLTSKHKYNSIEISRRRNSLLNGSSQQDTRKSHSSNESSLNTFNLTCTTSTPKHGKLYLDSNFDKEYSPIQTNSNLFSGNTPSSGSLCLGDFLVKNKKCSSKKKSNKRGNIPENKVVETKTIKKLKPTNLSESKFNSIELKSGNSYNFQNKSVGNPQDNVNSDFMTREISISKHKLMDKNIRDLSNQVSDLTLEKQNIINLKSVRFNKEIQKVVIIFEYLMKNGFVFSLVGELYFIMTLLLVKNSCDISECEEDSVSSDVVTLHVIFRTIHDITFFATSMLEKMFYLLESLDKITLRHLCENDRLKLFSPKLIQKLQKVIEEKAEVMLNVYSSTVKNNICFVLETDNQSNFPSDRSFQGFKKQRDMFYEILRLWENNHMKAHWDFEVALGKKVRTLIGFHKDPVNFIRLSRLFMEQLLNACSKRESSTNKNSGLLSSLSQLDKDKIDRLQNRLIKKPTNGINSPPDFSGYQEFFKVFIQTSDNPTFIRHLCNVLIAEIMELNGTTFDILNAESNENETELDTRKAFVNCLKSLKTLAKFLGFIESMPYKNENTHCLELMTYQIKIRNQVLPNLNIQKLLEESLSSGNLTLFIPWLCEYLSMLDTVTLRTNYYLEVIEKLMGLYRCIDPMESLLPFYNSLLIKFSLGWFFELNNFPHNMFFEKLTNGCIFSRSALERSVGLDRLNIVDTNILYIVCPFLEEFKKLLANETALKDRITSKHITPLSKVDSPKETIKKRTELQLEEAFFNSHPSSLKKTVDFVAERVASTCVKHLCYSIVPEYKKKFVSQLQGNLEQWSTEGVVDESELQSRCTKLSEQGMTVLKELCNEEVNKIIQKRVKSSLVGLLPMDHLPQMQAICISVSERMCQEKVQQWASTHIVIGLLTKEVKTELRNFGSTRNGTRMKSSYVIPACGNNIKHDPSTISGPHILTKIRFLSASVLTSSEDLQEESLIQALDDVYQTITQRYDLNEMIIKTVCSQLVDLMLILVAYQPATVLKVKEYFFKVWKLQESKTEELFKNFISLRNFAIVARSSLGEESLNAKAEICVDLIKKDFLTCECFESQCMGLFKYDLDNVILKEITLFLKIFVEVYKKQCQSSKFTYLLEFLSDYCSDM